MIEPIPIDLSHLSSRLFEVFEIRLATGQAIRVKAAKMIEPFPIDLSHLSSCLFEVFAIRLATGQAIRVKAA